MILLNTESIKSTHLTPVIRHLMAQPREFCHIHAQKILYTKHTNIATCPLQVCFLGL